MGVFSYLIGVAVTLFLLKKANDRKFIAIPSGLAFILGIFSWMGLGLTVFITVVIKLVDLVTDAKDAGFLKTPEGFKNWWDENSKKK